MKTEMQRKGKMIRKARECGAFMFFLPSLVHIDKQGRLQKRCKEMMAYIGLQFRIQGRQNNQGAKGHASIKGHQKQFLVSTYYFVNAIIFRFSVGILKMGELLSFLRFLRFLRQDTFEKFRHEYVTAVRVS